MKQVLLLGAVCLVLSLPRLGQAAPPNDNFSDRTVLTGNSVAFSGTLAGATLEPSETLGGDFTNVIVPTQSIWWTWTAPQTSLVTLEITSASADSAREGFFQDGVAVYDTTNVFAPVQPVAELDLDLSILCDAVTFSAIGGNGYQIQMLGSSSTAYQFVLVATNAPLILQAPRNLTVSANASTLFTVVAEGYRPLSYQWQFAGTNLAGQTSPMLALTNIDGSKAGNYSVIVSNVGGAVTSAPAFLAVSSHDVPPSLTAISGQFGQFVFGLTGEIGRNYRIESSVDLAEWAGEYSFPETVYSSPFTSVVFNTNSSSIFSISNNVTCKFLRASQYQPANEVCINNLRQIRFAKSLWQRDNAAPRFATPYGTNIAPYFLQGRLPHCPLDPDTSWDSSYIDGVNKCDTSPNCLIFPNSHILEEPQ